MHVIFFNCWPAVYSVWNKAKTFRLKNKPKKRILGSSGQPNIYMHFTIIIHIVAHILFTNRIILIKGKILA